MTGELQAVVCFSCSVWEAGDSSSPLGQHVCRKCLQLQLLEAQVSELKQRLETLWSIRESESIVDSTYREVVTPQAQTPQVRDHQEGKTGSVGISCGHSPAKQICHFGYC